jgi:thioesterase domain-containing protein
VLLHDGGGTTFSYHLLGPLGGRAVYGIHNPHFYHAEQVWTGGLPEMAWHYAQIIKKIIPEGDVILGGWSLGGCTSLEVAKILGPDAKLRVVGIIMIDSVYPRVEGGETPRVAERVMNWSASTRQETKEAVLRCFDEAYRMVREWKLPVWDEAQTRKEEGTEDGKPVTVGGLKPPPVWLLRAKETVPVVSEGVARVDLHRKDRYLGWKGYREDLIVEVVDVPGHHFNIFDDAHLDIMTERLRTVCREVESRAAAMRQSRPGSPVQAEPA